MNSLEGPRTPVSSLMACPVACGDCPGSHAAAAPCGRWWCGGAHGNSLCLHFLSCFSRGLGVALKEGVALRRKVKLFWCWCKSLCFLHCIRISGKIFTSSEDLAPPLNHLIETIPYILSYHIPFPTPNHHDIILNLII